MGLSHSPQIVTDGLVLCLDAANPKSYPVYNLATYSQDFENAVYSKSTGLVTATGLLAPDDSLTATTLTDDSTSTWENFYRAFTVPNDSTAYNISIHIKKTTGGTSPMTGFNIDLTGGSLVNSFPRFNTDTGVLGGSNNMVVTSENNNYWRISFTVTNNSSGNTTLGISYYPATGFYNGSDNATATGSQTVWGFQVTRGAALLPYNGIAAQTANSLFDLSGNLNDATLTNGPTFDGSNRGSLLFDGTDRYVSGALPTVSAAAAVTMEAVIKLNDVTVASTKNIFDHGRSGITFGYGMVINGNNIRFRNSNSDHALSSPTALATGQWYHLILTTSASSTTGYCNGISQGTAAQIVTTNAITEYVMSRRSLNSASEFMNGNIALLRVYHNKTFTQSEVLQNFNAIRGRYGI